MARYFLVGCSKNKSFARGKAASRVYHGALFWLHKELIKWHQLVAERQNQTIPGWSIVSAKYGLLQPTDEIEDYNLHIKQMSKELKSKWARLVVKDLMRATGGWRSSKDTIVLLMGADYATLLEKELLNLGYTVERPLKGLGIGQQKQWLHKEIARLENLDFDLHKQQMAQLQNDLELREELA